MCAHGKMHTRRHVHGLASQGEEQAQDLSPVAFKLLCGCNGRVAADAALPDGIADLVLAGGDLGQGEVGEEEQVDEGVDNLLGQRLGLFKFGLLLCGRLFRVGLVKDDLAAHELASATAFATFSPEELVFPRIEVVGLVQKGQQAGEDTDAVEGIALRGEVRVRKRGVVAQDNEARGDCEYQRLEVG